MTTSDAPDSAEQLHAMFRRNYPEMSVDVLSVNAEVITEHYPQLASLMLRIDAADTSRAGRASAISYIGTVLTESSIEHFSSERRFLTPAGIREESTHLWNRPDTKNDLMRAWALTNAAQETGVNMAEFQNRQKETMCERFHERHAASHLNGPTYVYGDFWHDTFYTDEYWRGLAAFCIIGDWMDIDASMAFILWAGQQEYLNIVTRFALERETLDPAVLAPLIESSRTVSPAVLEGVL